MTDYQRLTIETRGPVGIVTMNRPERRNAIDTLVIDELPRAVNELADQDGIEAIVLTGADPAFCAGLDLHELGSTGANLVLPERPDYRWPWSIDIPVIGAVNGPAIAGGFELALHCDFLVASDRAVFGDTHARVGQFPGAGLTVRLTELIGIARTKMMCLTGNFVDAGTARDWGIVVDVVPHDELVDRCVGLANDIADNDRRTVRHLLPHLDAVAGITREPGLHLVDEEMRSWNDDFEPADVAARRDAIFERSRAQRAASPAS